jgi:hypothetical protein
MISISDLKYSTPNTPQIDFPQFNEGQKVKCEFTLNFNYNLNSTFDAQFLVTAQNQITWLNGSFVGKVVSGDTVDLDAVIQGGTNVNVTGIVANVSGNVLTFTTNIFAAGEVNLLFPQGVNEQMFLVNTTRTKPLQLDIFFNLIPQNASPSNASLWDNSMVRLRINMPSSDGVYNFMQLGQRSGSTFITSECSFEKDDNDYFVTIVFIPALGIENNDFSTPSWYNGIQTVKPNINVVGYNQVGNPNNFISANFNQLSNIGWYNEWYNEGENNFTISDFLIEDAITNPMPTLSHNTDNHVSFKISHDEGVSEDIQVSIYNFFPFSQTKNNNWTRLQNQIGSLYPSNETLIFGEKVGAYCKIENLVVTDDSGDKLVEFDVVFNPEFLDFVLFEPTQYRLAVNVSNAETFNENVTLILSQNTWSNFVPPPTPIGGRDPGFLYFFQNIGDETVENYSGCTEDDFLFTTKFDLPKNTVFNNFVMSIEVRRNSDDALIVKLQETLLDFNSIPIVNGIYQFNNSIGFPQYLDAPNRNAITLNLTGETTSITYGVEFIASLMAGWRDWLPLINALPDFYDFNLPLNGQSREWVNYLRLAGYEIRLRLDFNSPTGQLFLDKEITLLDYNEYTDSSCLIELVDSLGNVQPVVNGEIIALNNAFYTIRATHTVTGMVIEDYDVIHGYIGLRPNNGEPMKRISTAHDWTNLNMPLQPLANETRAVGTVLSADTYRVECRVYSSDLGSLTTIVSGFKNPKYPNFWVFADWADLGVTDEGTFIAWIEANSDYTVDSVTDFSLVGFELKCNISASAGGGENLDLSTLGITEVKAIGNGFEDITTINLNNNIITEFNPVLPLPDSLKGLFLENNIIAEFNPVLPLPLGLLELYLDDNNISDWSLSLPWINSQPAFDDPCDIYTDNNPSTAIGTSFETIAITKNATIVE